MYFDVKTSDGNIFFVVSILIIFTCFTYLGTETYDLGKCLGKGTYGTVFKAVNLQTGQIVALKTQKPAWVWEFYITREIKNRLTNPHMVKYLFIVFINNDFNK